jgi:hypothetical protein
VRRWRHLLAATVLTSLMAGCGGDSPAPSPSPPSGLGGTWTGAVSDSSGPGQMSWMLSESGGTISGAVTITDAVSGYGGQGTISGTVEASAINFTITIAAGGFDAPFNTCSAQITGSATLDGSTITGTYSGSNSCNGTVNEGQLSLTRQ